MPQEVQVIKCAACKAFQTDVVKKKPQFKCKLCGEQQSVRMVFFRGSGTEARQKVEKLRGKSQLEDQEMLDKLTSLPPEYFNQEEEPETRVVIPPKRPPLDDSGWGRVNGAKRPKLEEKRTPLLEHQPKVNMMESYSEISEEKEQGIFPKPEHEDQIIDQLLFKRPSSYIPIDEIKDELISSINVNGFDLEAPATNQTTSQPLSQSLNNGSWGFSFTLDSDDEDL